MKYLATILSAAALAALVVAPARAADLPVKATPGLLTYPTGSGWFWGVSASGLGGTTSASPGIASGNLLGGKVGVDFGYTGKVGSGFWFVEQTISAQAIQGPAAGLSMSAALNLEQRYAFGVPSNVAAQILGAIPGLSAIAMPSIPALSGVTFGPSSWYVFASTYQDDVSASLGAASGKSWLFSYGAGLGMLNRGSNGWMVDTSIEWKHGAAGMLIGAAAPVGSISPFADAYLATVRLKF